jgi:hypothetical protein
MCAKIVGGARYLPDLWPDASPGDASIAEPGLRLPPVGDNSQSLRSFTWQLHTYGAEAARPDIPE